MKHVTLVVKVEDSSGLWISDAVSFIDAIPGVEVVKMQHSDACATLDKIKITLDSEESTYDDICAQIERIINGRYK